MNEFLDAINWAFIAGFCLGALVMGTGTYVAILAAFKKSDAQRKEAIQSPDTNQGKHDV